MVKEQASIRDQRGVAAAGGGWRLRSARQFALNALCRRDPPGSFPPPRVLDDMTRDSPRSPRSSEPEPEPASTTTAHVTVPWITPYEWARVVGHRAAELQDGAAPYVDPWRSEIDTARQELTEGHLPFVSRRAQPGARNRFEDWPVSALDLEPSGVPYPAWAPRLQLPAAADDVRSRADAGDEAAADVRLATDERSEAQGRRPFLSPPRAKATPACR